MHNGPMTSTKTITTAQGATRTDIIRDGQTIGFVGHLPNSGGYVAFKGMDKRLGCFTDFAPARAAVEQKA